MAFGFWALTIVLGLCRELLDTSRGLLRGLLLGATRVEVQQQYQSGFLSAANRYRFLNSSPVVRTLKYSMPWSTITRSTSSSLQ